MMISFLFIQGCATCNIDTPTTQLRQILKRLNKCDVYSIEYGDKLKFKLEKEIKLEECLADGNFVVTAKEIQELKNSYKDAKKCITEKCKQ